MNEFNTYKGWVDCKIKGYFLNTRGENFEGGS